MGRGQGHRIVGLSNRRQGDDGRLRKGSYMPNLGEYYLNYRMESQPDNANKCRGLIHLQIVVKYRYDSTWIDDVWSVNLLNQRITFTTPHLHFWLPSLWLCFAHFLRKSTSQLNCHCAIDRDNLLDIRIMIHLVIAYSLVICKRYYCLLPGDWQTLLLTPWWSANVIAYSLVIDKRYCLLPGDQQTLLLIPWWSANVIAYSLVIGKRYCFRCKCKVAESELPIYRMVCKHL